MSGVRKVKSSAGFPSRRISSDPLQPESQEREFSRDLDEFEEVSKTSVNETAESEFNRIKEHRRKEREIALKKRKKKDKEEKPLDSDSEDKDTRSNKFDVLA